MTLLSYGQYIAGAIAVVGLAVVGLACYKLIELYASLADDREQELDEREQASRMRHPSLLSGEDDVFRFYKGNIYS